jgi:hypothetical protein
MRNRLRHRRLQTGAECRAGLVQIAQVQGNIFLVNSQVAGFPQTIEIRWVAEKTGRRSPRKSVTQD